jgi:hypothetical protein
MIATIPATCVRCGNVNDRTFFHPRFCSRECYDAPLKPSAAWWNTLPPAYRHHVESRIPLPTLTARVARWYDDEICQGYYLWGGSGLGKTRAAFLMCRRILDGDTSGDLQWVNMRAFGEAIIESTRPNGPGGLAEYLEPFYAADYLLIDDLSKARFTPGVKRELYGLIDHRAHNEQPTFYTCEVGLTQIKAKLGQEGDGIVRRIQEFSIAINTNKPEELSESENFFWRFHPIPS